MKKIGKGLVLLLLALCLATSGIFVACNNEEEPPEEVKITDGRFYWGEDDLSLILKLKEDGICYFVYFMAGNERAGTWELKTQDKEYTDASGATKIAEQTLVVTLYDGTVIESAYAENTLWSFTYLGAGRDMKHEPDYEWKEEDEVAVKVVSVSLPKDATKNLTLYHNKTFADQIDGYIAGDWVQTEAGFDLKNESGEVYAAITQVVDGKCMYTPKNGTAIELVTEPWVAEYTFTGNAQATFSGESEAENVTVYLDFWADDTADVTMIDASYAKYTLLSGTWKDNQDGTLSFVNGENESISTAPDGEGNITFSLNVPKGEILAENLSVSLSGLGAGVVYNGVASPESVEVSPGVNATIDNGSVKMIASPDGNYSIVGQAETPLGKQDVTFGEGTYTEKYEFTYTDKDGTARVASPELAADGKVIVVFANVNMSVPAFGALFAIDSVTVTLGDSWNFLAANDYTTTDVTEKYTESEAITVNSASLFMKGGQFQLAFNVTIAMFGQTMDMPAYTGTYAENAGNITFSVPAAEADGETTTFTSADGKVTFTYSVPDLGANISFTFEIANKALVFDSVNGADTPYQSDETSKQMAEITAGHLTMWDGKFSVTFDAKAVAMGGTLIPGNAFCEGTYVENEDGTTTFTSATVGAAGTFTSNAEGVVSFAVENYMIMSAFSGGTVTFVFDIKA